MTYPTGNGAWRGRAAREAPTYVCDFCGHRGHDPRPVDQVQCPMCGEPVTPLG